MKLEQYNMKNTRTVIHNRHLTLHINKKNLCMNFSCIALLLIAFLPVCTALLGRWVNYIRYIAVLGFLLGVLLRDRKLFIKIFIILSCGFAVNLYFYYQVARLYTVFASYMAKSMLCFIYPCIALYYMKYGDTQGKKILRLTWMVILVVTSITTIVTLGIDPLATRVLANSGIYDNEQTRQLFLRNTASWGIMYGMVFTLPIWICQSKKTKNRWYMLTIVAVTISVIMSQIMYAIIFAIVFIGCLIIRNINVKKILCLMIVAAICVFLFQNIMANFLYAIYQQLDKISINVVKDRVYQLYLLLSVGQLTGDTNARVTLYSSSLMTFLRNPLIGYHMVSENSSIIGMHSQLLDILAATGLLGFFAYIGVFTYAIRRVLVRINNSQTKTFFLIAAMCLVLLMIVNPTWYAPEVFMAVFFMPFLADSDTA